MDILAAIPGVDFDAAWPRRVEAIFDEGTGLRVNFISRADLLAAKQASGRSQDLADIEAIDKASRAQHRKPGML